MGIGKQDASFWLAAFGPEPEFRDDNTGQELNQLPFAWGALLWTLHEVFDFRQQTAQARPELIPSRYRLEVFRFHPIPLHSWYRKSGRFPCPPFSMRRLYSLH